MTSLEKRAPAGEKAQTDTDEVPLGEAGLKNAVGFAGMHR